MKWFFRLVMVLSIVPLMAFTCTKDEGPDCHQHLDFKNLSNQEIIVVDYDYYASEGSLEASTLSKENYADIKTGKWSSSYAILPGQTVRIVDMRNSDMCLETYLRMIDCWIFFVLDADIVAQSTPEELTDGRAILDRIYYYFDDIQSTGTHLVYE